MKKAKKKRKSQSIQIGSIALINNDYDGDTWVIVDYASQQTDGMFESTHMSEKGLSQLLRGIIRDFS